MRLGRLACVLVVVLLAGCADAEATRQNPKPLTEKQRFMADRRAASDLPQNRNVKAAADAGYTAVALYHERNRYFVIFKPCGDKTYEDCGADVEASADKPLIYLPTGKPNGPNDATFHFDGSFLLLLEAGTRSYPVWCRTVQPSVLNPGQFRLVHDTFGGLDYTTANGGKYTKVLNGVDWQCSVSLVQ
jgi:hypothetical protein